ncbi:MAG TPA: hypothetical protein ENJ82_17020 [Bacteroidetes bacterium]|nr:hypothetical protein [Bacteroidota bacterium]
MKINIINIVSGINDVNKLEKIYRDIEGITSNSNDGINLSKKSNLEDAIVKIREGVTYQQILEEQNYKPINFTEFRKLADQIEWEHSLDELLAILD